MQKNALIFLVGKDLRNPLTIPFPFGKIFLAPDNGEVSEWFKELVLKTSDPARDQEFESLPLRHLPVLLFQLYS